MGDPMPLDEYDEVEATCEEPTMKKSEFLLLRSNARYAYRRMCKVRADRYATWQDRDRAQEWYRVCCRRLPLYTIIRPYSPLNKQSRASLLEQFPMWGARRRILQEKRAKENTAHRIQNILDLYLGTAQVKEEEKC